MGSSYVERNRLLVDGKPFYIRGGEVQYFRLPVGAWKSRLRSAKECGLNTITSYMPWYWHEPVEGAVDLTGTTMPERNLCAFLDMAYELELKVVARPGPFINSELRYGGIPEWLFRNHSETMSHRADGCVCTGRPIPAEGEPLYRRYVREWYSQVVPVIAEYDIHNGGPVILFQPDNELSAAWSFGLLNSLYDTTILAEYWPGWLESIYKDIHTVGNRYGRQYKEFADVEPPRSFPSYFILLL
jgi:beta-galactosidase